jgi:DNA-binding transcriptional regulator YdaS (Cro superfamily)
MKIAQWLDENESGGKDRAWLAEQMGVHPGTVDAWCNGSRKPKLARILKIQELTSGAVTPADWLTLAR